MKAKVFLIILALIIVGVLGFNLLSISGFSTLSLSRVDFTSNDADIQGPAFVLSIIQNGASQYAQGTFRSIEADGKEAEKYLKVEVELDESTCRYDIKRQSLPIQKMKVVYEDSCFAGLCNYNSESKGTDCIDGTAGRIFAIEKGTLSTRHYICVEPYTYAETGKITLDKFDFASTITATIDGRQYSEQISNSNTRSVSLKDGQIYATWNGNIDTGEQCPSPSDEEVMTAYRSGWRIIDEDRFDTWRIKAGTFKDCLDIYAGQGDGEYFGRCVDEYNSYAELAYTRATFENKEGKDASISGGEIKIDMDNPIQFPLITMRIKAETLGIVANTGKPKIVDVEANDIATGDNGYVSVFVRNDGGSASTTVQVSCDDFVSLKGISKSSYIPAGDTEEFLFQFSGDSGVNTGTADCEVKASDTENPLIYDIEDFTIKVTPLPVTCKNGEQRCTGTIDEICAGGAWQVVPSSTRCEDPIEPNDIDWLLIAMIFVIVGLIIFIMKQVKGKKRGRRR